MMVYILRHIALIILAFLSGGAASVSACPVMRATVPNTMAILAPCVPVIIKDNQVVAPTTINVPLGDTASVASAQSPYIVEVQAPGMVNIEAYSHGKFLTRLTSDGFGDFIGQINLRGEPHGPLNIALYAWNKPPGDNSFTVNLAARMTLFVVGSSVPPVNTFPNGAAGLTQKWSDEFDTLNAMPCKPGTGVWPKCSPPTAANATWYENKTGGGDFGDAAFEHTDSPYSPYFIKGSFLRIRAQYDPSYTDPYGFNRKWYSGLLSSAFPDGSTNFPGGNGYYEARILIPDGSTSAAGHVPLSGGTFPAFWMLTRTFGLGPGGATSNVEEDVMEANGPFPTFYAATQHAYGQATGPSNSIYHAQPGGDLTWDFHRYGLLITTTTVSAYFDDKLMGSLPRAFLPGGAVPDWFVMLDLAMGSGWPVTPPLAGYYDMWVDYVRYYAL
jgi:Glycosyl hydrolases family 16